MLRYLLLAIVLLIAPGATAEEKQETPSPEANDTFKQLSLFADVIERVRVDYVDAVTDEKLIESAVNGMLVSLDPHSAYLNKKAFTDMQTQTRGEFGGLGIEVTMENNLVKVVSPIDDTPAAKAGIQPLDLITHIDNKPVADLTLNDAVDLMRGKPGTQVTLTIRRGGISGQPFDVTLTRAVIRIQSVRSRIEGKDVGYIRITTFNEQTQMMLDKALEDFRKEAGDKLIGYVIDMRNNPGGLLDQAVSVAGTFLPVGTPVVETRGRQPDDNQVYTSRSNDQTNGKPIVVLINGGSASASEIVAGALQDHKRAIVLGIKSFGKGSVQTIIPLGASGGAMRLTTARYFTPKGRSIQAEGIVPDIEVQQAKLEEVAQGFGIREADLKGALPNPNKDKNKTEMPAEQPKSPDGTQPENKVAPDKKEDGTKNEKKGEGDKSSSVEAGKDFDYQLARAVDLLRGLNLYIDQSKAK